MSEFDRFANGAKTFLTSALTSSGTFINVDSITSFPVPPFKVVVNTEIIKVEAVDQPNKAFSLISRAQEGTTAASHYIGSQIVNVLTKDSLLNLSVDNNIANFALSSSETDPYASSLSNRIYLIPKNGDRISLIDPIENIWRIFYIKNPNPNSITVNQDVSALNKLVDVFAYYDNADQQVKLYQSPSGSEWSIDNPSARTPTITRTNGILTISGNTTYRYLDTYQIKKPTSSAVQVACFGWKTLNKSTSGNIALYHNNFSKIMIKQTGNFNTIYAIEKGYDGQKIILLNDSSSSSFYIDKLALSIPSGFAGISGPNNISLKVDINAGIELYYDACFEKWNILENKTVA
jgi:hypothetical protein